MPAITSTKTWPQPERAALTFETDKRETEIKLQLLYLPFLFFVAMGGVYLLPALLYADTTILEASIIQCIAF